LKQARRQRASPNASTTTASPKQALFSAIVNVSSTGAALPHSYVFELNSNLFGFIDAYEGPLLGAFQRFIASSLKVAFGSIYPFRDADDD
jgi:hypothetical protein